MAETKARLSGEQLKQQLDEVRQSVSYLNDITLALIPRDHNITIGDKQTTRAELKQVMQANDRALAQIGNAVKKGVRRRAAGESAAPTRGSGGLSKPNLYSPELVAFFLAAPLGKVDPSNPKSEDLVAVLKRSAFGKTGVCTSHTLSRLFSILINLNDYKDKTNGQKVAFPAGFLEKHLPSTLAAMTKAGKATGSWSFISLGSLSAAALLKKDTLDDKQKETLAAQAEGAAAVDRLTRDILAKYKDAAAPAPVVPASLAAAPAARARSPAKSAK